MKKEQIISTQTPSTGDILGGFSAMLVALPSAIAFGLIIFSPLGIEYAGKGVIAGLTGSIIIGIVASFFGGTSRLISAPCAPAAAVLSVFVLESIKTGNSNPEAIPLYIAIASLGAGIIQFILGSAGGGAIIKFIPYPVVAGYLGGVGTLIILGQIPHILGVPKSTSLLKSLSNTALWRWDIIVVGIVSMLGMSLSSKFIQKIPSSIIALGMGIGCYLTFGFFNPKLLVLENNPFIIGQIKATFLSMVSSIASNVSSLLSIQISTVAHLFLTMLTLGILLSIDTLKTCVVLDAMTGSRHNSNKELRAQGIANISTAVCGGIPGAGTMGASLINIYSGGKTKYSGLFQGLSALAVFLFLSKFIALIPIASLAGVLIVVGFKMIDWKSIKLLKNTSTIFDFIVILSVIIAALSSSLIVAAGVGIAMAIALFLREQIRFPVVRRVTFGDRIFSKKTRIMQEQHYLEKFGNEILVAELQGQLFFGTTDQLYSEIEPYIKKSKYFIIDMRRVLSIDFTAAKMLTQIRGKIRENGGIIIFSSVPQSVPTGQNVLHYLENLGFDQTNDSVKFFKEFDEALEWAEENVLIGTSLHNHDRLLDLIELEFFRNATPRAIATLKKHTKSKTYKKGKKIFKMGDYGGEIFFIRKGLVRIEIPLDNGTSLHRATFGKGGFFGDMSFLDSAARSADAIAAEDTSVYILDKKEFDKITKKYPDVTGIFYERLAFQIAQRLRASVVELKALEEN